MELIYQKNWYCTVKRTQSCEILADLVEELRKAGAYTLANIRKEGLNCCR